MENLTPITRKETFLAKAAGQDVETPTPVTREEAFLDAIAKGGGGGGGGGSSLPSVTSADIGKVLGVDEDGEWSADGISSYARRVGINATITASGALQTSDVISWDNIEGLANGTRYLQVNVDNAYADITIGSFSHGALVFSGKLPVGVKLVPLYVRFAANGEDQVPMIGWLDNKFIVTLTPTSPDFSGTMDKTVAEINAAYVAGQEIWFRMALSATEHVEIPLSRVAFDTDDHYRTFMASVIDESGDAIICAFTISTNGTNNQYGTRIYPLTPAS